MATPNPIRDLVADFVRIQKTKPFHMSELTEFVQETMMCAPDSAGRELRYMRARGEVAYTCISRSKSLYQIQ